jgi:hypothetical protein
LLRIIGVEKKEVFTWGTDRRERRREQVLSAPSMPLSAYMAGQYIEFFPTVKKNKIYFTSFNFQDYTGIKGPATPLASPCFTIRKEKQHKVITLIPFFLESVKRRNVPATYTGSIPVANLLYFFVLRGFCTGRLEKDCGRLQIC